MKKSLFTIAFVVAALLGSLAPRSALAETFEGHVKMNIQLANGKSQEISYAMKGQRMRTEFATGKESMVTLFDWSKREMSMLMPGQKMYMVIEMKDIPALDSMDKSESTTLEKTNETAKIAGRTATKYIARDGKNVVDLWLTSGLGSWFNMSGGNPMKPKKLSDWEKEIIAKGLFPLRTVTYDAKGKQTATMEVVELTPQKLDDSLFEPPAGYTRFSMGGLLKGFGGK
jgi:outer membrane lipoprotein-sorting protein